ncbi:excalibur calcium-binding domain-containing protein [Bacillus thuringiensis]
MIIGGNDTASCGVLYPSSPSHLDRDGDGVACERNKGHKKSSKKH